MLIKVVKKEGKHENDIDGFFLIVLSFFEKVETHFLKRL
jgi:hypothetical protein